MAYDEVEVSLLQEMIFDAAHHRSRITLTDFWDDDANGEAVPGAQGSGKKVWTVFVLLGRSQNPVLRFLGDGVRHRRTIDDQRNRGRGEAKTLPQFLEAHRPQPHAHGSPVSRGPL